MKNVVHSVVLDAVQNVVQTVLHSVAHVCVRFAVCQYDCVSVSVLALLFLQILLSPSIMLVFLLSQVVACSVSRVTQYKTVCACTLFSPVSDFICECAASVLFSSVQHC